jgi:hypothetical protein
MTEVERKSHAPVDQLKLTFPEDEKKFLESAYEGASTILEYGSGGSTMLAARLGKHVVAIESDPVWAASLNTIIGRHGFGGHAKVIHSDIGPVGLWGKPYDNSASQNFPNYALAVWEREDFQHPDVVLVDGRFRTACVLATILNAKAPVLLLFDDYSDRSRYHWIEKVIEPTQRVGRMAVFEIVPGKTNLAGHWLEIVKDFSRTTFVPAQKKRKKLKF